MDRHYMKIELIRSDCIESSSDTFKCICLKEHYWFFCPNITELCSIGTISQLWFRQWLGIHYLNHPQSSLSRFYKYVTVYEVVSIWRCRLTRVKYYSDVIMSSMASQITSLTTVYSTVYSGADQRKLQSSASLAFVRGIHRWLVNSPHKWPVTRKMSPFDDVIMKYHNGGEKWYCGLHNGISYTGNTGLNPVPHWDVFLKIPPPRAG